MNDIRNHYESIYTEVRKLNTEWQVFRQLFAETDERVVTLKNSASTFFFIIKNLLVESIILTLCRLTDPEKSFGKFNLSLKRIVSVVQQSGEDELAKKLLKDYEDIKEKCKPMRDWRNRKLSHADLNTSLDEEKYPMPPISFKHFGETITQVNEFTNATGKFLKEPYVLHEDAIFEGGVDDLVFYLEKGLNASEMKFELLDLLSKIHKKINSL